jgi:hypothetical protein
MEHENIKNINLIKGEKMKKFNVFIFVCVLCFTFTHLHPAIYLNDTDPVFHSPARGEISNLIIDGAEKFLDSYSEALLILREYEISEKASLNFNIALQRTESALEKLEDSRKQYARSIAIGEKEKYVDTFRDKLMAFNYEQCEKGKSFNATIVQEVTGFLKDGDVLGLYKKNLEKIDGIISVLKDIKDKLNNNIKPDVSVFWTLLQKYSETVMFGNCATVLSSKSFGYK